MAQESGGRLNLRSNMLVNTDARWLSPVTSTLACRLIPRGSPVHPTVAAADVLSHHRRSVLHLERFMAVLRSLFEIRMANYQRLLREFAGLPQEAGKPEHGLFSRFADYVGVNVRYLSHINNGRKNIGDAFARQLERGMDKQENWMDRENLGNIKGEPLHIELAELAFCVDPRGTEAALLSIVRSGVQQKGGHAG